MNVEIGEKCEEEATEKKEEGDKYLGVVTVKEEWGGGVDGPGDELDQLHACNIPLPPQIFLNLKEDKV